MPPRITTVQPATFRRLDEPHRAFADQVDADEDEGRVVDQGGHDLDPAVAEGHALVRRTARDLARDEGDDQ
jgi:CubicO group peptidase (beta-lactamase class C family)